MRIKLKIFWEKMLSCRRTNNHSNEFAKTVILRLLRIIVGFIGHSWITYTWFLFEINVVCVIEFGVRRFLTITLLVCDAFIFLTASKVFFFILSLDCSRLDWTKWPIGIFVYCFWHLTWPIWNYLELLLTEFVSVG